MTYVWQKIKILKNRNCIVNWDEWRDKNRSEIIKEEINKISKPWVPEEELKIEYNKGEKFEKWEENLNKEFSMTELDRVLRKTRIKSAPGLDGIEYRMIKELSYTFKNELLKIFNECWKKEKLLDQWKEYGAFFIDKKNKQKVRLISISSCVGKLMERMVNERLNWWIEKKELLDKKQNGFRKRKGCMDNLLEIIVDIRNGIYENKITRAAFLDVSSAYDNVQRNILIKQLYKIKCPKKNYKLYKSMDGRKTNKIFKWG